jgi:3-hydroxymyristoyl/3-hydroxydecanoyl-(acyl carrier protein) dehydratase
MPNPALIDWNEIDLTRVLRGPSEIQQHCLQRGQFSLLDGILHFDLEGSLIVGFKDLRASDWWAKDHIPGRPIFPGVLQVEGAAQLATFDFMHRRTDLQGKFVGFAGLNETRFRGLVEPPARILWAARIDKVRANVFTYQTQAFVEKKLVFETEIMGMVL